MVRLMNISCDENKISCDYIPENSDNIGEVTVDIKSREVTNVEFSKYEYGKKMYVAHVRARLSELLDTEQPVPKETIAIWY